MKKYALELADRGFRVFPLVPKTKNPLISEWQNKATIDKSQIEKWWTATPKANIGIATGQGIVVIDLDMKHNINGISAWSEATKNLQVPETLTAKTPTNGGLHLYFRTLHQHRNTASKVARGVDTRGDGGYVVAPPSKIDIGEYTFINNHDIAVLTAELELLLANAKNRVENTKDDYNESLPAYSREAVDSECQSVSNAKPGERNSQLVASAFALGSLLATDGSGLTQGYIEQRLLDAARSNGLLDDPNDGYKKTLATIKSGISAGMRNPRTNLDIRGGDGGNKRIKALTTDDYANLLQDWKYDIKLNLMNDEIELNGNPLTDITESVVIARIRDYGITKKWRINVDHAMEAISILALANSYHPIKDYLENCIKDTCTGTIEILCYHMTDRDRLACKWIRHWLVGAIAKVFEGYQNPVLVLDGSQEIGKSFLVNWLCPLKRLFYAGTIQPENRDCRFRAISTWIWEIEELGATTRKQDVDALKAFITMTELKDRKPYGRRDIQKKVVCSYVGTINNSSGFLVDKTGNRRFHVLSLERLDWNYTKLDINKLWGEAYLIYKSGEWRLSDSDRYVRDCSNEQYQIIEPIEVIIESAFTYTGNKEDFVTSNDLLQYLSGKTNINQRAQAMEIAATLKKMGGVKIRKRINGTIQPCYQFIRRVYYEGVSTYDQGTHTSLDNEIK